MKLGITTVYGLAGAVAAIVVSTLAFDARYENEVSAQQQHDLLAADREDGDLRTRRDLIEIKIQRLKDISALRELTEAERIDLRSFEAERAVLLSRLASKG
jgi:hypothetical protein